MNAIKQFFIRLKYVVGWFISYPRMPAFMSVLYIDDKKKAIIIKYSAQVREKDDGSTITYFFKKDQNGLYVLDYTSHIFRGVGTPDVGNTIQKVSAHWKHYTEVNGNSLSFHDLVIFIPNYNQLGNLLVNGFAEDSTERYKLIYSDFVK